MMSSNEVKNSEISLKIPRKKIFVLETDDINSYNDEVLVLQMELNDRDAARLIHRLSFDNLPSVFIIVVKCPNDNNFDYLKGILSHKIDKKQEIILQLYANDQRISNFFHKQANSHNFLDVKLNSSLNLFTTRFKVNKKNFKAENLFEILNSLKISLIDVDFKNILIFLNLSLENDKFLLLKNAIAVNDVILTKILLLFISQISAEFMNEAFLKPPNMLLAILNNFSVNQVSDETVELLLKNSSILPAIAELGNRKMLKILIKNRETFYNLTNFNVWCEARRIALENEFHEFLYDIQLLEREYYGEVVQGEPSKKRGKFCDFKYIEVFHENISNDDLIEVKKFVEKFPHFKFCFDKNRICALDKSLIGKNFQIYSFLFSKSFLAFNQSQNNHILNLLTKKEKREIRRENLKNLTVNPHNFINILATKCNLFSSGHLNFPKIQKMLEKLCKIEEICEVLRVASHEDVQIVFDFKTNSVIAMDPSSDEHSVGMFYFFEEKTVYVGKNSHTPQRYGTFAHEMTHFVMYLLYENGCLPYCKGDLRRKTEWLEVVQKIQTIYEINPEGTDKIIQRVFDLYEPGEEQQLELIVRVNELLAFYQDDLEKIRQLKIIFEPLFDFYRNFVLVDLKIPHAIRMLTLNNDLGLIQSIISSDLQVKSHDDLLQHLNTYKRILLVSNIPQLTLSSVYHQINNIATNKLFTKVQNIFINLEKLSQLKWKSEFESLIATGCVKTIIAHGNNLNDEHINFLNSLHDPIECLLIVDQQYAVNLQNKLVFHTEPITHTWNHLTETCQKKLLQKTLKFNEVESTVSTIFKNPQLSISSEILSTLCSPKEILLNHESQVEELINFIPRRIQKKRKIAKEVTDKEEEKFAFDDFNLEIFLTK